MNIVAPFRSVSEVEMLVHFGADEVYCGVHTPEWQEHFGDRWWMNRRSPSSANLTSWPDMKEAVERAHGRGVPVYLTLNAPFYPAGTVAYVVRLAGKLTTELHIDGFIVSDVNLLVHLSEAEIPARIHLSSLGTCLNSRTVDFYKSLGVRRIILPRQLRLSEILRLARNVGEDMELEVFGVNDGCFFEEGLCQTTHSLGPFCLTDWTARVLGRDRGNTAPVPLEAGLRETRSYLWHLNNCGSSSQADGLPNGPCSLCWFACFRDAGVKAVKIVGREASFYRKMRSVQLVKAVMDEVRAGATHEQVARSARSARSTPEYCDKGYMCYFRDA